MFVIIGYFLLGCLTYSIVHCIIKEESKPINLELTAIVDDVLPSNTSFNPILMNILSKDIPEEGSLDPEEASTLIGIYKSHYHPAKSNKFFKQLKYAPNQKTAKMIFNAVMNWEIRRSDHESKKDAINCILNAANDDIELKQWLPNALDRGFLSNLKEKIMHILPIGIFTSKVLTRLDFLKSTVFTFTFYWDVLKDVATFALFNHMSVNILVSIYSILRIFSIKLQIIFSSKDNLNQLMD